MAVVLGEPWACSDERAELGEGTRWDAAREELIWVDLLAGVLRTASFDGIRLHTRLEHRLDVPVGAAAPLADGSGWVVAAGDGLATLSRTGELAWLARPEQVSAGATRMNDAACDPRGRFLAGSMAYDATPGLGSLYRLDPDGAVHTLLRGVTISNGLGWSPDGGTLYYADTGAGTIDTIPYDPDSGALGERTTIVRSDPTEAAADGLTVDDDGHVWAAIWGAGEVRRYSPSGRLETVVRVPASQPTCCWFGGPGRSTLFISTAWIGLSEGRLRSQPDAGRVFAVRTSVTGPAATPFRAMRKP